MLAESHVSIHTYPEKGSAFLDVFTCGNCDPEAIAVEIASELGADKGELTCVARGQGADRINSSGTVAEEIAPGLTRRWEIEEVRAQVRTKYQDVLIGRTAQGESLFCENERQSTELSQLIYHEGQIIPAALMADKINRVLIIGSSEGVISQLALELGASDITHVDIDEACVRLCAEFLPYGYTPEDIARGTAGKGPVAIVFQDAFSYVESCIETKETFDIIVMDLPDEQVGEAQQNRLYEEAFLKKVGALLSPDGAFITQAGSTTYWRNETLVRTLGRMKNAFETTAFFEMEEQDWAWVVGTNFECDDVAQHMSARLDKLDYIPQFVDATSIPKATTIPLSIRRKLSGT